MISKSRDLRLLCCSMPQILSHNCLKSRDVTILRRLFASPRHFELNGDVSPTIECDAELQRRSRASIRPPKLSHGRSRVNPKPSFADQAALIPVHYGAGSPQRGFSALSSSTPQLSPRVCGAF